MHQIIVLGAGIVGVGSALALQQRGFEVLLIDRRDPGEETSFGNAGVIQAEAHAPYAMPRTPATLLKYALGRSNDLSIDWKSIAGQARALLMYYKYSAPQRHKDISSVYASLTSRACRDHEELFAAAQVSTLIRKSGLGDIYDSESGLAQAEDDGRIAKEEHGISYRIVDGADLLAEEPLLLRKPAGALIWEDSWSCLSPGDLVLALAGLFESRGGTIARANIQAMSQKENSWYAQSHESSWQAEHIVVAAGPWTPELLRPLGYRIPMIYKRGYHRHVETKAMLTRPYLLADHGVVMASMSTGLRVTTGAHVASLSAAPTYSQLEHGLSAVESLVKIKRETASTIWQGTRPCLPDMLPVTGQLPEHPGLWVNFGHGHQGFTLGPTTGKILAQLMSGDKPEKMELLQPRERSGVLRFSGVSLS